MHGGRKMAQRDRELGQTYRSTPPFLKEDWPIRPTDRSTTPRRIRAMILDQINYEQLLVPINKFYDLHIGGSRRPVFFDIATTRPELLELDRNYHVIRDELRGILPDKRAIPRYHELDQMQYNISARVDPDKDWKIF